MSKKVPKLHTYDGTDIIKDFTSGIDLLVDPANISVSLPQTYYVHKGGIFSIGKQQNYTQILRASDMSGWADGINIQIDPELEKTKIKESTEALIRILESIL